MILKLQLSQNCNGKKHTRALNFSFSDEKEKDEDNEATEETGDGKGFAYEIYN